MPYILPFPKIKPDDKDSIGDKAYSLYLLHQHKLPIGNGFVVTLDVWKEFFTHNHLDTRIQEELKLYDLSQADSVLSATKRIQSLITSSELPKDFVQELFEAYDSLVKGNKGSTLSIRSSICSNDEGNLPHPLYLQVTGEHTVAERIKEIYAQLVTPSLVSKHPKHPYPQTAVIIQEMFTGLCSGFIHTQDPYTKNKHVYVVEAVWGLGEILDRSDIARDKYLVDKRSASILLRKTYPQHIQLTSKDQTIAETAIPFSKQLQSKLTDIQLLKLLSLARNANSISVHPQTIEWGFDGRQFIFFQTQELIEPSGWYQKDTKTHMLTLPVILEGYGDNPGIGTGIISYSSVHNQSFNGEVVVVEEYVKEGMEQLMHANAIINLDSDNKREIKLFCEQHGIPLIHSFKESKKHLQAGQYVTVDGSTGFIYRGTKKYENSIDPYEREITIEPTDTVYTQLQSIQTKTNVYLDFGTTNTSPLFDMDMSDGVAVFKGEALYDSVTQHPQYFVQTGTIQELEHKLKQAAQTHIKLLGSKQIFYKLSDICTEKAHTFLHSSDFETKEHNPMLGFRGLWRHVRNEQILKTELSVLSSIIKPESNLQLVLPFFRHTQELEWIYQHMLTNIRLSKLSRWLYLESPANCINIPQYKISELKGVIVDVKNLTMLTLGLDPLVPQLTTLYDEFDPAVLWLLKRLTNYCREHKLKCILSNFYTPLDRQRVSMLLQMKVDGLSVKPTQLLDVKKLVASLEKD